MMTMRGKAGFTLIELIITVAIVAMMLTVALPQFFQTIAQRRLTAAVERVMSDLRYVRSLAVTQGTLHRLHSGADGTVGRPGDYRLESSIDGGTTWSPLTGWFDPSADYSGSKLQSIADNGGTTIATFDVRFNSQGAVANTGVGSYPIILTVVARNGTTSSVRVMRTGTVRVQ